MPGTMPLATRKSGKLKPSLWDCSSVSGSRMTAETCWFSVGIVNRIWGTPSKCTHQSAKGWHTHTTGGVARGEGGHGVSTEGVQRGTKLELALHTR